MRVLRYVSGRRYYSTSTGLCTGGEVLALEDDDAERLLERDEFEEYEPDLPAPSGFTVDEFSSWLDEQELSDGELVWLLERERAADDRTSIANLIQQAQG